MNIEIGKYYIVDKTNNIGLIKEDDTFILGHDKSKITEQYYIYFPNRSKLLRTVHYFKTKKELYDVLKDIKVRYDMVLVNSKIEELEKQINKIRKEYSDHRNVGMQIFTREGLLDLKNQLSSIKRTVFSFSDLTKFRRTLLSGNIIAKYEFDNILLNNGFVNMKEFQKAAHTNSTVHNNNFATVIRGFENIVKSYETWHKKEVKKIIAKSYSKKKI